MDSYKTMTARELVAAEEALDHKDPDLWQEIMDRAEEQEPGITAAIDAAVRGDSPARPDDIFYHACALIVDAE